MKNFILEFKQFAMRGNVIDLAVAVVIGTAFGRITSSLVDNIIMPFLGILMGGINLSDYSFTFIHSTITYGVFIQSVIEFILIAFAVFVFVKVLSKVKETLIRTEEVKPTPPPSEEVLLLREIRDSVKQ
ncbi:large conductance mechanosensitive channel protein MscL [Patescibacteria group bacterium]|nr:large conductance mechanosensitive channel protein MscL [Patescibacteria group bacterium]